MFKPNRKSLPPLEKEPQKKKKSLTTETKRRAALTAGLTVVLMLIWCGVIALGEELQKPMIAYVLMTVYFVAFAGILIAYLVYNRAFVNKNVTVEMLPLDWSVERKEAFVAENRRRAEKSRWMVMLIIPFAAVFLLDSLYLFFWDPYIAPLLAG